MRQRVISTPVSIRSSLFRFCFTACSSLLLLILFSHRPQAADAPTETIPVETLSAMTWPLLPGENLRQLARMFSPSNTAMHALLIRQSLELSRAMHPQLAADQRFEQITSIVIPELKSISHHGGNAPVKTRTLKMSRQLGEKSMAIVTETMRQQYQALVRDNQEIDAALETLHQRLQRLQQNVEELTAAARGSMRSTSIEKPVNPLPASTANSMPSNTGKPVTAVPTPASRPTANTGENAFSRLPTAWPYLLAALAGLLLFALLLWLLQRKRRYVAADREQFTQWLNTVQPDFAQSEAAALGTPTELPVISGDALQQARILTGSGKPKSAIQLLAAAVESEAPQPLEAWLYLLDLCREHGLREEFETHAQQLHQHFNIMTPQWEKVEIPLVVARSLEEFPHISEQLVNHWQAGNAADYLQSLLTDNRGGERAGFGPEVMEEILLLQGLLKQRE